MKNKLLILVIMIASTSLFNYAKSQTCTNCGMGTNTPNAKLEVRGCTSDSTTGALKVTNSVDTTNTPILFVRDDKRVGINTIYPKNTLHVQSTTSGGINIVNTNSSTSPNIGFFVNSTTTSNFNMGVDGSDGNKFKIGTTAIGTNTRLTIDGSGRIGIGVSSPSSSALMDLTSTTMGMLAPRMTEAERNAISSPATGLLIYQTNSTPGFYYYNGTSWVGVSSGSGTAWNITGNSGTTAGTNFIGNTDAVDLVFKTNNTENLRIKSGGNIGVGVTSPTNILSFDGTAARKVWMERHTTSNTAGNNFTIQSGGATSGATNKSGGSLILSSGTSTGNASSVISFQTATAGGSGTTDRSPSTKMTILGNGNVGIGTTNPTSPLTINTPSSSYGLFHTDGTVGLGSYVDGNGAWFGTTSNDALLFYTNNSASTSMTIAADGNVGIGNDFPSYSLHLGSNSAAKPGSSTWTVASDSRVKKDVIPFTDGLNVVRQINTVKYKYNGLGHTPNNDDGIGILAQQMQAIAPYTVKPMVMNIKDSEVATFPGGVTYKTMTKKDGTTAQVAQGSILGFDSHPLFFVLINAVKQLDVENSTLKADNTILKNELADLKARIIALENK